MKFFTQLKTLLSYFKNSFFSLLSFFVIKFIKKKNILELVTSLKNNKVLVLGTGPSLDKINQDLIDKYQVIIFLNKAINVVKLFNFDQKKKIFFNSDLFMFNQIKEKINSLDNEWIFIFIPVHLQLFLSLIKYYFKKNVFLLIPKYRIGSPFEKNVTKSIITYKLATIESAKYKMDINNFKAFPYTVALNAFYFLISCKVNKLHYLGCDFTLGRSVFTEYSVQSDLPERNKKIFIWLNKLKKLANDYSVDFKDLK